MPRTVHGPLRLALFALLAALLVSACGQAPPAAQPTPAQAEPTPAAPAEPTPAQAEPTPAQVEPTPAQAGSAPTADSSTQRTLTVGLRELVTSFDYPYDWAIVATWIHSNIGDCLVWRDRETAEFIPWLAESWENVDETTWTMKLREGITFHNGEPFNAEAVKYTIERIQADETALVHPQWLFISEVNIIDDYNIEFKTGAPEPAFLSKMSGTACQVVPPGYTEEVGTEGFGQAPVGTGPFKFVEWVKDDRVVLEANPDYFQGAPGIDRLVFRAIPEDSTRVAELLTGGVDLIVSVPIQDWERVESTGELALDRFTTTQVQLIALRSGPSKTYEDWTGVTENPLIRQAIAYAIDRQALVDLLDGMAIPTMTRITPPTLGSDPNLYGNVGTYDPERARALLEEAGYNGEPLTFHSTTAWPMQKEVTETIAAMLQDVGLNIDLQILEITAFREQVYAPRRNEEIYMDALGNSFFDPWITVLAEQSDRRERSGWSGPQADEADALIRAAAVNMNPEERAEQYIQIQNLLLAENGGPYVFLYQLKDTIGRSSRVSFTPAPDGFLWFGAAAVQP
ncbi:MAG: ABC transporter substrate-binding protein [Chloroflexi bacterium OHK40]